MCHPKDIDLFLGNYYIAGNVHTLNSMYENRMELLLNSNHFDLTSRLTEQLSIGYARVRMN